MKKIVLSNGKVLGFTKDVRQSLLSYLALDVNKINVWNPVTNVNERKPRWPTIDDFITFQFQEIMKGVLAVCPIGTQTDLETQIDALRVQKVTIAKLDQQDPNTADIANPLDTETP